MIALFETDHKNINRYYLIHDEIRKQYNSNNVLVIFDSLKEKNRFSKINKNKSDYLFNLSKHINEIEVLIINANRIPDIYISTIAKKKGIPIIYIQHGPHSIKKPRNLKFYISKFLKVINHLYILAKTSFELNSFLFLYKTLLVQFIKGGSRVNSLTKFYSPDISYVFSEYYRKWHKNYYFGHFTKYKLIRNNDSLLKNVFFNNHLIFCHQTLVEDGRIAFEIFKIQLESIKEFGKINSLDLCVKSHPRMSVKLRNYYLNNNWIIHDDIKTIPIGEVTVGFYSSLLSLWAYNNKPVISLKLPIKEDMPAEISEYCFCTDSNKIKNLKLEKVLNNLNFNKVSKKADYFFNFTGDQIFKF